MKDYQYLNQAFEETDVTNVPVIIVEDDPLLGASLQKFLQDKISFNILWFENSESLMKDFVPTHPRVKPFLLVTDISLGAGTDGLVLIDILRDKGFKFTTLVMTGFASVESAISATKKGVFHYLTKPFDLEKFEKIVRAALKSQFNGKANESLISNIDSHEVTLDSVRPEDIFAKMVGRSKAMKSIFEKIKLVANSDSTILITGESGTGKELVAQAIHNLSKRSRSQRVSVNCGAIPGDLLESELFGHVKGAFTGAILNRKGRFEVADKGTIFLDEIGDMPVHLQVKLLRVLQEQEIEPIGSSEAIKVDTRVIAATHRDLEKLVSDGRFREDLYYRLNVIPIRIPSLKERREDIPLLVNHFLTKFSSADRSNMITFDDQALELLVSYDWPGNVRELENVIERLVILRGGNKILPEDLPAKIFKSNPLASQAYKSLFELPDGGVDLKKILSDIEDSLIVQAMKRTGGNKNQASKLLTLNRTTLIEKMKKKELNV